MKQKEIILRILNHDNAPRTGWNFNDGVYNDFTYASGRSNIGEKPNPYGSWGKHEPLLKLTGFSGEVMQDRYGNIYGRFNGLTKGECIRGVLQTWDDFDKFQMPELDPDYPEQIKKQNLQDNPKFVLTGGSSVFSTLRDARLMANALVDTFEEPEMVVAFCDKIVKYEVEAAKLMAGCGIDGVMMGDDWGTQDRTFISPASFRELFKPAYKAIFDAYHEAGIKVLFHSCGYIHDFIDDFIDAGVDSFQFDQPDAYPAEVLASEFGSRATFYSPVDIQKVLPTGDREVIETRTRQMLEIFRATGSWIAKDYPSYRDIGVELEWAKWAEDIIVRETPKY